MARYNAQLRERCGALLSGPHGAAIDRILRHIEPYVGTEVGANTTHLLASDIVQLLHFLSDSPTD